MNGLDLRCTLVAVLIFSWSVLGWAQDAVPSPGKHFSERTYAPEGGSGELPFWFMPPAVVAEGQRYPLVIDLHQSDGSAPFAALLGTDEERKLHPAFVLVPIAPKVNHWARPLSACDSVDFNATLDLMLAGVESKIEHLPIDPERVYIVGLEKGAAGVLGALASRPDIFAGGVLQPRPWDLSDAANISRVSTRWVIAPAKRGQAKDALMEAIGAEGGSLDEVRMKRSEKAKAKLYRDALKWAWAQKRRANPRVGLRPRLGMYLQVGGGTGIFKPNENIPVLVHLRGDTYGTVRGSLRLLMAGELEPHFVDESLDVEIAEQDDIDRFFRCDSEGVCCITVRLDSKDLAAPVERSVRIAIGPESVTPVTVPPRDLAVFWAKVQDDLKKVRPRYKVELAEERELPTTTVHRVEMMSLNRSRVRGWLQVPEGEGPFSAILRVRDQGEKLTLLEGADLPENTIVFTLDGLDEPKRRRRTSASALDIRFQGLEDPALYYLRGAVADGLRAIDYLSSREDLAPGRILVEGQGQGATLGLIMAALDRRIGACSADRPTLCDTERLFALLPWPALQDWVAQDGENRSVARALATLSYFDVANLASRIECPVTMGIALQDPVSPAITCFGAYNRIRAPKTMATFANSRDSLPEIHRKDMRALALKFLKSR